MRISDWSSDVCSSDLHAGQAGRRRLVAVDQQRTGIHRRRAGVAVSGRQRDDARTVLRYRARAGNQTGEADIVQAIEYRSEERRVGKEGVRTCRSRWSQCNLKKKKQNKKKRITY